MKKILILSAILVMAFSVKGQYGNRQPIGSVNTENYAVGSYGTSAGLRFINSFADTFALNSYTVNIKAIPGIMVRVGDDIFVRSNAANQWIKQLNSGTSLGTVTSFSSGNLSPLFTTSVATASTTPALSFSLNTQTANLVFAGPSSGGAATPTFRSLVAADIAGLVTNIYNSDGTLTSNRLLSTSTHSLTFNYGISSNWALDPTNSTLSIHTGTNGDLGLDVDGTDQDHVITTLSGDYVKIQPLDSLNIINLPTAGSTTGFNVVLRDNISGQIKHIPPSSIVAATPTWQSTVNALNTNSSTLVFDSAMTNSVGAPATKTWMQIKPLVQSDGTPSFYTNMGAYKYTGVSQSDQIWNMGWNLSAGGSQVTANQPGIGYQLEQRYIPTAGDTNTEAHLFYIKKDGTQKRLYSYTIKEYLTDYDYYNTVSRSYLKSPIDDAVYYSVSPGQFQFNSNGAGSNYFNFQYDSTVGVTFTLSNPVGARSAVFQNFNNVVLPGMTSYTTENRVSADVVPSVDSTYDIGNSTRYFKRGYFKGDVSAATLHLYGLTSGRVPVVSTSGLLVDYDNFKYDNTNKALVLGGATGSTWDSQKFMFDAGNNAIGYGNSGDFHLISNAYGMGSWKYYSNGQAANMYIYQGAFNWRVAPSGSTGGTITWLTPWQINNSGHLLSPTDNTYDIGASGATRPRTGYFGTSVIVPTVTAATLVSTAALTATGAISLTDGANKSVGQGTLSGGTLTVNNTRVTANSRIFLTLANCSSCGTIYVSAISASTSFTVTSSNGSDASLFNWMIIN